jgi:hypothetical protein
MLYGDEGVFIEKYQNMKIYRAASIMGAKYYGVVYNKKKVAYTTPKFNTKADVIRYFHGGSGNPMSDAVEPVMGMAALGIGMIGAAGMMNAMGNMFK